MAINRFFYGTKATAKRQVSHSPMKVIDTLYYDRIDRIIGAFTDICNMKYYTSLL